jgi:outer membrane PBP1 activator LpoA protein
VSSIWNNDFDKYTRLYALGLDSYKIALQLADMHKMDKVGIAGMTGVLKIDNQHNIHRDLMWAKFVQGKPKLIGSVG